VAQIVSDGRSANAPDQAAHSSLSWGDTNFDAALYGMTDQDPKTLAVLARSWNFPAELGRLSPGMECTGYDFTQRAYMLINKQNPAKPGFSLRGSDASPVVNPVFVIKNLDSKDLRLSINGKPMPHGKDFRFSTEYDVEGNPTTIIWIKYAAVKPVDFEFQGFH
jgi:hypothetical protein